MIRFLIALLLTITTVYGQINPDAGGRRTKFYSLEMLPDRAPNPGRVAGTWGRAGDHFDLLPYAFLQPGSQHQVLTKRGYLDGNGIVPIPGLVYNKHNYTLSTPVLVNVKPGLNLACLLVGNSPNG
ncbi:hypothetical protein ACFPMF_26705 [Larkinella bovis]|uniref:Uncharacterized protein n=1 Tax=Larkinella bovis TaxID=683041 RepID=A0ABW0IJI3_9BACT